VSNLLLAMAAAVLAGAMIPLGASLASIEQLRPKWLEEELRHGVMAFGGGVLIAAVAFLLVPVGTESVPAAWAIAAFVLGGMVHSYVDRIVESRRDGGGHLIALVSDYVPEAMAMGAMFATGADGALLLALMLGIQNLPEGFTAYRELRSSPRSSTPALWPVLGAVSLLGLIAVIVGHVVLAGMPMALGTVMLFAAGGIFYLVFQDVAYDAHMERAWAPALGAVAGFAVGMLGHNLLG
jgi:zinc transporter, ZIP family